MALAHSATQRPCSTRSWLSLLAGSIADHKLEPLPGGPYQLIVLHFFIGWASSDAFRCIQLRSLWQLGSLTSSRNRIADELTLGGETYHVAGLHIPASSVQFSASPVREAALTVGLASPSL